MCLSIHNVSIIFLNLTTSMLLNNESTRLEE